MADPARFRIRTRMVARDTDESNRASSPLELLFDLTFVVAVAQIATALGRNIEAGTGLAAIVPFLMVFFAIWWAWMNFTWFASSYDTDDVPYRLLTLLQMGGVLVLAAGVPAAFGRGDYFGITLGYFIMRVGLVTLWVRAAREDPVGRATARRYAIGVTVVQLGWILRLLLPVTRENIGFTVYLAFVVLATLEVSVPPWAERTGGVNWHPHHIAERYGLFTIILLGASIAALADGVEQIINATGTSGSLITVGVSAIVLIFALWWLYFLQPAGEGLAAHRSRSFLWGYGHYFVFAALAAFGAGLEVVVASANGRTHLSPVFASYSVTIPVAVYLVFLWAVHAPIAPQLVVRFGVVLPAAVVVLLLPLAANRIGMPVVLAMSVVVVVALVVVTFALKRRELRRSEVAA
ncbi:MAG: low temperature requirement protein [Glaciihabitans sp.]|nr:low temperature requirement protein [Glaciihabitans sp.]